MSAIAAPTRPLVEPRPQPRHIEVVPTREQKRARPRIRYAVVAVLGIAGILLGQLSLSLMLSEGAYRIDSLRVENRELSRTVEALTQQQLTLSSTQNLVSNAAALGMVTNSHPVYLRLSDGAVFGDPVPAADARNAASGGILVGNALVPAGEANAEAPAAAPGSAPAGDGAGAPEPVAPTGGAQQQPPAAADGALPSPVTR